MISNDFGSHKGCHYYKRRVRFYRTTPVYLRTIVSGRPVSFGTLPYYGVNTFKFINVSGKVTYGRYRFLPEAGEHLLKAVAAAK